MTVPSSPESASRDTFVSDTGQEYLYDRSQLLGAPGRFGRVYAATNSAGTALAVKEVEVRARVAGELAMVDRELQVARRAASRLGLLPIFDVAHLDGRLLIVMPRAERSLADAISDRLSRAEATAAIWHIAEAMQQLGVALIAHRDLKPANILWWNDRWCVADFGIARLLDVTTATLTWEGTGTAEYRAPELWRGDQASAATDLYAFGCVAFEVLTGRLAFPGPDHRQQHESSLPDLDDDVEPTLSRVVYRLLAKQPELRPPDARSVLEALTPRRELTDAHRVLQRRAASAERRDRSAEAATEQERRNADVRERGRALLRVLWDHLAEYVRQGSLEAEASESREGHFLVVADARLAAVHAGDLALKDLLAVVDVVVHDGEGSTGQLVANLTLDAPDGLPRWRVVRWHCNDISLDRFEPGGRREWAGLRFDEIAQQWKRQDEAVSPLIRKFSDATPPVLLDLLSSTVGRT
ncbi:MAG: serine/threonine-protein kinase [Geodermatophilaceae bacterium]